jgi:hypothetical protein
MLVEGAVNLQDFLDNGAVVLPGCTLDEIVMLVPAETYAAAYSLLLHADFLYATAKTQCGQEEGMPLYRSVLDAEIETLSPEAAAAIFAEHSTLRQPSRRDAGRPDGMRSTPASGEAAFRAGATPADEAAPQDKSGSDKHLIRLYTSPASLLQLLEPGSRMSLRHRPSLPAHEAAVARARREAFDAHNTDASPSQDGTEPDAIGASATSQTAAGTDGDTGTCHLC